jgi:hypothetical protein
MSADDEDGCPHGLDERWCSICIHGPTKPVDKDWVVSECKSENCRAEIVWCHTENGRRMPVDAEPVVGGNIRRVDMKMDGLPVVHVLTRDEQAQGSLLPLYVSHFRTCPDAERFRRR